MERRARDTFLSGLSELTPAATVTVNGAPRQQAPVLEALRAVHHVESHHSSPLTAIQVEVRDGAKTIKFVVAQDSERPDEYWVYRPGRNYHNDPLASSSGALKLKFFAMTRKREENSNPWSFANGPPNKSLDARLDSLFLN